MKHKLNLNFNTYPFCFASDSIITSILANEELVNEQLVELVDVIYNGQKFNYKEWIFSDVGIENENTDDGLIIKSHPYSSLASGSFFREIKDNKFECIIHVKNQILRSGWSYVGVFVAKDLRKDDDKYIYDVSARIDVNNNSGLRMRDESLDEDKKNIHEIYGKMPCEYWLKMVADDDNIITYYTFDGENWSKIAETSNSGFMCMGVEYNFFKTDYYDWFFYHYTNITSSKSLMNYCDGTPLEYYQPIQKDYDQFIVNPFLEFSKIPFEFFGAIDRDKCIDVFKSLIDAGSYVKVTLNEYFIPNRHAYKNYDFPHENLVFGYDTDKKVIYIAGYDINQIVTPMEIDYETFIESFYSLKIPAHIIKVAYPYDPPELTKEMIYKNISDYLNSVDLHKHYIMVAGGRTRNYGISFFETLLSNQDEIKYFLMDKRLAHFIYEHEKILNQLVIFLFKRNLISQLSYENLKDGFKNLEIKSNSIRTKVLKVMMRREFDEKKLMDTSNQIRELYELEKEMMLNLLEVLKTN